MYSRAHWMSIVQSHWSKHSHPHTTCSFCIKLTEVQRLPPPPSTCQRPPSRTFTQSFVPCDILSYTNWIRAVANRGPASGRAGGRYWMSWKMPTAETANQSCELDVRYVRTWLGKVFPSPVPVHWLFFEKRKIKGPWNPLSPSLHLASYNSFSNAPFQNVHTNTLMETVLLSFYAQRVNLCTWFHKKKNLIKYL